MGKKENTELVREMQEELYREKKSLFGVCGNGGYYASQQREYAIEQIDEYGIRCRQYSKTGQKQ